MNSALRRIMVIAGEASGDQYGARVVRAVREHIPETECFGIGGDLMRSEGVELLFHISQTGIMGFIEVVKHARFLRRMFRRCKQALIEQKTDAILLIDYPGFNLRFAKIARAAGVPVLYYISPQVWAWGKKRIQEMKHLVDHLAVVFPFEEDLYQDADVPVTFVGHPLLEILQESDRNAFLFAHHLPPDRPILGLFPGSRVQEIDRLLPPMLDAAEKLKDSTGCFPVIGAAQLADKVYRQHTDRYSDIPLLRGTTHALMQHSYAALVASGTATVETAYYKTPMLIIYRSSFLNYHIGKKLIQVSNIGMPNILAGKRIVPELLQHEVNADAIVAQMLPYFNDTHKYEQTVSELQLVRERMGTPGASSRVAKIMLQMIDHNRNKTDTDDTEHSMT